MRFEGSVAFYSVSATIILHHARSLHDSQVSTYPLELRVEVPSRAHLLVTETVAAVAAAAAVTLA